MMQAGHNFIVDIATNQILMQTLQQVSLIQFISTGKQSLCSRSHKLDTQSRSKYGFFLQTILELPPNQTK